MAPSLLERPLASFNKTGQPVSSLGEAFVARLVRLGFELAATAQIETLTRALGSASGADLLHEAMGAQLALGVPGLDAEACLRADMHLLAALERTGGFWTAEECHARLRLSRARLHQLRQERRILALSLGGTALGYPVVQFVRLSIGKLRPHPGLQQVLIAGDRLHPVELFGLLALPQPTLGRTPATDPRQVDVALGNPGQIAYGDHAERTRTGWEAIHDGDASLVVALLRHLLTRNENSAEHMSRNGRGEDAGDAMERGDVRQGGGA